MRIFIITAVMLLTLISPATAAELPKAATVEQALNNLKHEFPDWRDNYEANVFDCSEMSAFVRDYLDYCELKPELQVGRGYGVWGYSGWVNHAWVVCQGQTIECTSLKIRPASQYKDFVIIHFPPGALPDEYDWWNSEYMQDKGVQPWQVPSK